MESDTNLSGCKVVATRLERCVPDQSHIQLIQDAVKRVHRIVIDGTELIALHLTRCLQQNLELPYVDAAWAKVAMMEVSMTTGKEKKRSRVDDALATTRCEYMPTFAPTDRVAVDNILMAECIAFAAAFQTNLHRHFRKRAFAFVCAHFDRDERLPSEEWKQHKLSMMLVASDLCKPSTVPYESSEEHHEWVSHWRTELGLCHLTKWDMSENVKHHQAIMLHATWAFNKEREAKGKKTFSICPIRRHLVPRFVNIDTKAIGALLHTGPTAHERATQQAAAARRNAKTRSAKKRIASGVPVRERVVLCAKQAEAFRASRATEELFELDTKHSVTLQRYYRGIFARKITARRRVDATAWDAAVVQVQRRFRGWSTRHKLAKRTATKAREESKEERWSDILRFDAHAMGGRKIKHPKGSVFAGSLRTDGVSVRLLFRWPQKNEADRPGPPTGRQPTKTKKKAMSSVKRGPDGLPRPGLYAIDQLKHESRLRCAQIIGADPGKRELLVCVDVDHSLDGETGKRRPSVRYTSAQRRAETLVARSEQQELRETPGELQATMRKWSDHSSRSPTLATVQAYFQYRRLGLECALVHFEELTHRSRAWRRHSLAQKSLTDFVRRIRSMSREDAPMVLAYGSWANVAGRPGAACNKGHPPCIGKGLRDKLAKHFIVAITPEAWTSKTCSCCGYLCGPCDEADAVHQEKMLGRAVTDEEKKKARRFSVRGLRRCKNEACAIFLNRDYNAAMNIGIRCKSLLWPDLYPSAPMDWEPPGSLDRLAVQVDAELDALHAEINS